MSLEPVNIYTLDDNLLRDPVEGVIVRVYDSTGTNFITQATSNTDGIASTMLTAPATYQLRFFKEKYSIRQPMRMEVLVAPSTNNFNAVGHVFKPPEAVHPRLCRCSGFFKRPDGSPAVGHDVHFITKFDPLLFEGDAMLTERLQQRTDDRGYMQIDLVRNGKYDVTIEGFEDCLRLITVPDAASVNLPDLFFPVVEGIEFDDDGPWSIGIGTLNEIVITPTVRTSDGRILSGTAITDVRWSTTDPNVAAVLPSATTLTLRGLSAGQTELRAERLDGSIIRIPNSPIQGVPQTITVT